jgi:hypothetical protein
MKRSVEEQFEKIAEDVGRRCSSVGCSLSEYVEGIDLVIEELKSRKQCAEEELKAE